MKFYVNFNQLVKRITNIEKSASAKRYHQKLRDCIL